MEANRDGGMEAVWVLPSGTWKRDAASGVFSLLTSALGNATSPILTRHDVSSALTVSTLDTSDTAIFPPEFGFDPATGLRLNQIPDVKAPPWIRSLRAASCEGGNPTGPGLASVIHAAEAAKPARASSRG